MIFHHMHDFPYEINTTHTNLHVAISYHTLWTTENLSNDLVFVILLFHVQPDPQNDDTREDMECN